MPKLTGHWTVKLFFYSGSGWGEEAKPEGAAQLPEGGGGSPHQKGGAHQTQGKLGAAQLPEGGGGSPHQ